MTALVLQVIPQTTAGLKITTTPIPEDRLYTGIGSASPVRDTPAKMLVLREDGKLMPCNYQYSFGADDHFVWSGNSYIPCGDPVKAEDLIEIDRASFRSEEKECVGSDFHDFIRRLMEEPSPKAHFIVYVGRQEETTEHDRRFLFIKLGKAEQKRWKHNFALCRFRPPLDEQYETRLEAKKRADQERLAQLKHLEENLTALTFTDWLTMTQQDVRNFEVMSIEHTEEKEIPSGGSLPSIKTLKDTARTKFVKKAPRQTVRVVAVREDILEVGAMFFTRGKQRVTYRGIAVLSKAK